jgi:DNA-binding transcriptional ArsR family regulator
VTVDEKIAGLFKCLSHPTRLAIMQKLAGGKMCVQKFVKELGIRQPNVSQHLAVLRQCGLVRCKREGGKVCYYLEHQGFADVIGFARNVAKKM